MLKRYDIDFEVPVAWCNHPMVGQVHKQYVLAMRETFKDLGVSVTERHVLPIGEPRRKTNGVVFSYHTCGNNEHQWHIKEGYLPYLFTFDRTGYSGWLSGIHSDNFKNAWQNCDENFAIQNILELGKQVTKNNISKYPQGYSTDASLKGLVGHPKASKKFLFLPLQMPDDTVVQLSRFPYIEAVSQIIKAALVYDQPLIIKRHPLCEAPEIEKLLDSVRSLSNVCISSAPIHEIFKRSKAVICCNSGVGFEALLQGLQVWTFGASDYSPVTHEIFKIADFAKAMQDTTKISQAKISTFLCTYLHECCVDVRNKFHLKQHVHRALSAYENSHFYSAAE
jgi:hypothetical protein